MGVDDWLKDKLTPGFVKEVNTALTKPASTPAAPPAVAPTPAPVEAKTPQQLRYEATEKAMNRNNPFYQNVDKPVTTEPLKVNGNP